MKLIELYTFCIVSVCLIFVKEKKKRMRGYKRRKEKKISQNIYLKRLRRFTSGKTERIWYLKQSKIQYCKISNSSLLIWNYSAPFSSLNYICSWMSQFPHYLTPFFLLYVKHFIKWRWKLISIDQYWPLLQIFNLTGVLKYTYTKNV